MTAAQLADKLLQDEHADVLRESVAWMASQLMEADVSAKIGAALGERSLERTTHRNGYRPRDWDTRVGSIELAIPRLRQGSYFPSFLEPRRAGPGRGGAGGLRQRGLYPQGRPAGGADGPAPSEQGQVSRLCRGLDTQVKVFRERPLQGAYPYLWLDAKIERVREPGGVRHKALVVAYGVHASGRREVIGLDVGEAETQAFWRQFLRSLRARGLDGVRLCISDAHQGLKNAIAQVLGCPWQRCTVHFLPDMLGHVTRAQQPLVSGAIRGIFTATTGAQARQRLGQVADQLRPHTPKVARLLEDAEPELLAFYAFPAEHWPKLRSTNPLERVNREIGRRSDVVGIFPNDAALLRLAGMLLLEQNDEWLVGRRHLSETSMALVLTTDSDQSDTTQEVPQLTAP